MAQHLATYENAPNVCYIYKESSTIRKGSLAEDGEVSCVMEKVADLRSMKVSYPKITQALEYGSDKLKTNGNADDLKKLEKNDH